MAEKTRVANRMQKILEDANIKLASVATDILGASGRDMLRALIAGEQDPEKLADLARRQLRSKIPELRLALEGKVTEHHRFMLGELLDHLEYLEGQIERVQPAHRGGEPPFRPGHRGGGPACRALSNVPPQNVVAEIGADYGAVSFGAPPGVVGRCLPWQ